MKKVLFLIVTLLFFLLVPVHAQTSSPTSTPIPSPTPTPSPSPTSVTSSVNETLPRGVIYDVQLNLNLYAPARISFAYSYTSNFTGPVDLTTLSNMSSLWDLDASPVQAMFTTSAIDTFSFSIILTYPQVVNQIIVITTWSGDLQPNVESYHIEEQTVYLHVTVSVSTEPKPATPQEVANYTEQYIHQDLVNYYGAEQNLSNTMTMNTWIIYAIWAGTVIAVILSLVISLITLRKLSNR